MSTQSLLVVALAVVMSGAQPPLPWSDAVDPATWVGDVEQLMTALRSMHPDMHRTHTDAEWKAAASELEQALPGATAAEAIWGFKRLLAMLDDSHTFFRAPRGALVSEYFPIVCRTFADGLYVRTGHTDYETLFGRRITSIGGVPVDEAFDRIRPYICADNDWSALDQFESTIRHPSLLRLVGLLDEDSSEVVLGVESEGAGEEELIVVRANTDSWVTDRWRDTDRRDVARPFYRAAERNFEYRFDTGTGTLHFLCERVRDEDDESIRAFTKRLLAEADERIASDQFRRLVIDVRDNNGGNGYLWQPFIRGIMQRPEIDRYGRLFVLVSRDTFSAAWLLVADLERFTDAIIVGEPTPHRPNSFGDPEWIELPRSGIRIRCSALLWQMADPRDERQAIVPELLVVESWADFHNRRDPLLEAAESFDPEAMECPWPQPNMRWFFKTEEPFLRDVPDVRALLQGQSGGDRIVEWLPVPSNQPASGQDSRPVR